MISKIYPAVTTTPNAHWRQKIQEVKDLGLSEISLFLSAIKKAEREELYQALKETKIETVPFVHLRSDADPEEIRFLLATYRTRKFNIHSQKEYPLLYDLSAFKDLIYLENGLVPIDDELPDWAGLCLDTSHLEDQRLAKDPIADHFLAMLKKYPCGLWHLNSIKMTTRYASDVKRPSHSFHSYENLSEFDYALKYKEYLPEMIVLELENSIPEQFKAKEYIERIFGL